VPVAEARAAVTFEELSEALREVATARALALRGYVGDDLRLRDALRRVAAIALALADTDAE